MNILVIPLFALSRMSGPWSRAQRIAAAFQAAGHQVILGVSDDGNCLSPCVKDVLELPVPSPLGLPLCISSRTFPLAEKLGISGRKPVHSFEEVLWLTGNLAYGFEQKSVEAICSAIEDKSIDAVYSEYSLPAIIAAHAAGIPVYGSFSYTTQTSFASDPGKARGIRKLLEELGLPEVDSSLELFDWIACRFIPSCRSLEPLEGQGIKHVGFLEKLQPMQKVERDCLVVYLGSGSVPQRSIERTVTDAFSGTGLEVFVAGAAQERQEGSLHFAPRFDFSQLLPRAKCFLHHGGQNSTLDALAHGVPQIIVPGRVFERIYNAESIEKTGAGVKMDRLDAGALSDAFSQVAGKGSFQEAAQSLQNELSSLGGAQAIVQCIEAGLGTQP